MRQVKKRVEKKKCKERALNEKHRDQTIREFKRRGEERRDNIRT